jgi:glycosyltransferase involved in cell wall biosynthesis
MPELVRDGKNGLLFSLGDVGDLADKIDQLFRAPEMVIQMGTEARRMVETQFSLEANDDLLIDIFDRVRGISPAMAAP